MWSRFFGYRDLTLSWLLIAPLGYFLSIPQWDPVGLPDGSAVKNPSAMQETWVQSLGQEDPLEKEMTTHCTLAWEIPWTEKLGGPDPGNRVAKSWTQLSNLTTATSAPATLFPGLGSFLQSILVCSSEIAIFCVLGSEHGVAWILKNNKLTY